MATKKSLILTAGLLQELNTSSDKIDLAGNSTSDLSEGTNQYFTNARSRGAVSVTDSGGLGSLAYNSTSGVITYTGPSSSEVIGTLSVASGSGLTLDSSSGEIGTNAIPNSQLANSSLTVGSTAVALGGTATTIAGLTSLTSTTLVASTTLNIGAEGAANSIKIASGGITYEGSGVDAHETTVSVVNPTGDRTINFPDASGTVALLGSLSAANSGTGFGSLAYNSGTGAYTYTVVTAANIRAQVSVTDSGGDGSLAYNNSTGVITYTGPSAAEARAHVSVASGSGLTYNSTSGEFGTNAIPNAQLANSSITIGSTGIALGTTASTLAGLSSFTCNAIVTNDDGFRVRDNSDNTKQLAFELSGVSSGTTRTLTIPNVNGTIADEGFATAIAVALG
tara:strand:+ start:13178 stop:14359 length:1182 start_codon:yes stop_codon:yes gene_type:complete